MTQHSEPLDDLLAGWARRQRLDDAEAADILRAVVASPAAAAAIESVATLAQAGLPSTWWQDFGQRFAEAMLDATGVPALA